MFGCGVKGVLCVFVWGIWRRWLFFFFFFNSYCISNEDQNILVCPERLLECSITVDLSNSAFTVVIRETLVLIKSGSSMTSYSTILNISVKVFTYSFGFI